MQDWGWMVSPHLVYGIWSSQFLETRIRVIKNGETCVRTNMKFVQHLSQFKNESNLREWTTMIWTMLIYSFKRQFFSSGSFVCVWRQRSKIACNPWGGRRGSARGRRRDVDPSCLVSDVCRLLQVDFCRNKNESFSSRGLYWLKWNRRRAPWSQSRRLKSKAQALPEGEQAALGMESVEILITLRPQQAGILGEGLPPPDMRKDEICQMFRKFEEWMETAVASFAKQAARRILALINDSDGTNEESERLVESYKFDNLDVPDVFTHVWATKILTSLPIAWIWKRLAGRCTGPWLRTRPSAARRRRRPLRRRKLQ